MRNIITAALLAILLSPLSHAVSCGTVAAPLACSVNVGGVVKYTFSNFTLVSATASGGATQYTGADVAIDVASGGGNTGLLTFSKVSNGSGIVFLANAGGTTSFTFSYNIAIEAIGAAGVVFGSPFTVNLLTQSHVGNGSGVVQFIISGPGVSCTAITQTGSTTSNCVIPGSQPATLTAGNISTLSGNTGNVSIGSFTNLFTVATAFGQGLDVDGNGTYSATTDGLLAIRYLLGLRGAALINGAIGANPTRSSASAIQSYLANLTQ